MKNLSNLMAVLVLVAMMGLLAGCGCGTTNTPAEDDMVNNTQEALPPVDTTPAAPVETTVDDPSISDNDMIGGENDGTIVDENGNIIDDAVGTEGNLMDDAGNVVGDMIEDAGDAVTNMGEGVKDMTDDTTNNTTRNAR